MTTPKAEMRARDFAHLYTLDPGDRWCWIEGYVVIANPEKIPFTIDLATGERKDILPVADPTEAHPPGRSSR